MNVNLPRQKKIHNRRDLICDVIKDASVLHIGCTDSPYTQERIVNNSLLHQRLLESARHVVGLDINNKDIQLMRDYGIDNLYVCDIYKINEIDLHKDKFAFIVFSEVLEHLPNAVSALTEIRNFIEKNNEHARLVITVPNINSYLRNTVNVVRNIEQVHPEHVSYYSYTTSKNILEMSGFEVVDFYYATYGLRPVFKPLAFVLNMLSSSFMPCVFIQARIKNKNE